jgi:hypothetical protein
LGQFAAAIGVAALGTLFFARAAHSYISATNLVLAIAAALYSLTLLLATLLPKHSRRHA